MNRGDPPGVRHSDVTGGDRGPSSGSELARRVPGVAATLAIAIGALLRIWEFARNNGMDFDEAALGYNIATRTLGELTGPLVHEQMAPLLFLWVTKLSVLGFGVSEWAFRLPPLLASIGALILFQRLAARVLSPWPMVLATLALALSAEQVHYAATLKQYSLDTLVTTLLVGLAVSCYQAPAPRTWWALVAAGAALLAASMPSIFVLGGIGAAMALIALRPPTRRLAPHVVAGLAIWLLTFGAVLWQSSQDPERTAFMQWFWNSSFLDPRLGGFFQRWSGAASEALAAAVAGPRTPAFALVVLVIGMAAGLVTLARRRWTPLLLTIVVPPVLMVVASGLHFYPIAARLLLFLAPLLLLLLGLGVDGIGKLPAPAWRIGGVALLTGATLFATVPAAWNQATAASTDETALRPLVRELEARNRSGETVYLYHRVVMVYVFYSTDWLNQLDLERARRYSQLFASRWGGGGAGSEVHAEGDALRLTDRGRGTVIGLGTGAKYLAHRGFLSPEVAPGWAANELRRIRAEGSPTAWLLFGRLSDSTRRELIDEIRLAGATIDLDLEERGAHLYRVHFPEPRSE